MSTPRHRPTRSGRHFDRLPAELSTLPCSPTCAKTLADNRAWVRAILGGGLAHTDEQPQADRYSFELARPDDPDIPPLEHRILRAVSARIRWRTELRQARQRLSATRATTATASHERAEQSA